MIDERSTLQDVVFEVAAALERHGIDGVLTGGSAAAVYAPHSYSSFDADFVLESTPPEKAIDAAVAEIGFKPTATVGMFKHARSKYTVDFPRGPLAVGGDYVHETATIERGDTRLRILTPTDCVRDRLAHLYHWNDYHALSAAAAVARAHRDEIDFVALRAWTEREGGAAFGPKYEEFLRRCTPQAQ